ncbi:transposase [Actinomadura spongiicola]|uniref:transposase n=1 Tax=Actinomadura spongiicola TaxID=2303421 RepID=UPI0013140A12|nr:transposase [Actinomadura spongiicola]
MDRILMRLDSLFDGVHEPSQVVTEVGRLSTQLVLQATLDAEVALYLGRDSGEQRTVGKSGPAPGVRSGHRVVMIRTTAGPVELWWPRLRGGGGFVSRLYGMQTIDVQPLAPLVVAAHVRRLTAAEVQDALTRSLGTTPLAVSPTTLALISGRVVQECEAWGRRRFDGREPGSIFFGAAPFAAADGSVLVAGGVMRDGRPTFMALAPGSAESVEAWTTLLADLARRGLRAPASFMNPVPSALVTALARAFFAPAS